MWVSERKGSEIGSEETSGRERLPLEPPFLSHSLRSFTLSTFQRFLEPYHAWRRKRRERDVWPSQEERNGWWVSVREGRVSWGTKWDPSIPPPYLPFSSFVITYIPAPITSLTATGGEVRDRSRKVMTERREEDGWLTGGSIEKGPLLNSHCLRSSLFPHPSTNYFRMWNKNERDEGMGGIGW